MKIKPGHVLTSSHLILLVFIIIPCSQIACGAFNKLVAVDTASQPRIAVGKPAPTFDLRDVDGQEISLSSLQGSPVVINFWASWCGPCKAEMDDLQAVYENYRSQGLVLLSVNFKESQEVVIDFTNQREITFPVLLDSTGDVSDLYTVNAVPSTFFIDQDGIIQRIQIGSLTHDNFEKIVLDLITKDQ